MAVPPADRSLVSPVVNKGLTLAQKHGMIGGDLDEHIAHAAGFIAVWPEEAPPSTVVDLGTGGGLPGLILADLWSEAQVRMAETRQTRADTLEQTIRRAEWAPRVEVWSGDVQRYAVEYREWAACVTARLFASPAITAECAAPLLAIGGWLIVSEPPLVEDRWNGVQLEMLGFGTAEIIQEPQPMVRIPKIAATPAQYPRARKAMERKPLW